jgi:hypothetical protein
MWNWGTLFEVSIRPLNTAWEWGFRRCICGHDFCAQKHTSKFRMNWTWREWFLYWRKPMCPCGMMGRLLDTTLFVGSPLIILYANKIKKLQISLKIGNTFKCLFCNTHEPGSKRTHTYTHINNEKCYLLLHFF